MMKRLQLRIINAALLLLISIPTSANEDILPPLEIWSGVSEKLIHDQSDLWQTPAEKMALLDTPNYQQSVEYINKLVESDQRLNIKSIGKSPQNRDIWLVIASQNGVHTPSELKRNGKPTLLIQAGIHAGEIDGKDAGLMLLRDIIHGEKGALLTQVNILFVPIFNVDGHERISKYNRVNQRGPHNMGWRTTAQNLNLNRDYAKADTLEMQHLMTLVNTWQPDLYFDIHVTDGEDYQYDLTYGFNGDYADSPNISQWLSKVFSPKVNEDLAQNGHKANPLVFGLDNMNFSKGLFGWTAGVRFSNGWGDIRHLPTILVENHSLKPYKQRVLATYVFLESALKILAQDHKALKAAQQKDNASRPQSLTLAWSLDFDNPTENDFAGIEYSIAIDTITGIEYVNWNGKKKTYKSFPTFWAKKPKVTVDVPKAYYIPPEHIDVISRLKIQGIKLTSLPENTKVYVNELIASEPEFGHVPFEGHMTAKASFTSSETTYNLPKGTIKVSTNQPLGRLAVALLDPRGPDSFFSWGFFNQMFQRTEYIESYAMAPLAQKMLNENPALKAEFLTQFPEESQAKKSISNAKPGNLKDLFDASSDAKMQWLYQRSKYHDNEYMKYPVLFEY